MKPIQNPITALILISVMALGGCATTSETKALEAGPTMAQAYQAAMQESDGSSLNSIRKTVHVADPSTQSVGQAGLSQATVQEHAVQSEFQRLPNPNIVIYVYPHLATAQELPIQGYYTEISLYERVHYAIPGEMPIEGV